MATPQDPGTVVSGERSSIDRIKTALITGTAITLPLVVTVLVLVFVTGFLASLMDPLVSVLVSELGVSSDIARYAVQLLTALGILVVVTAIGFLAGTRVGSRLEGTIDAAISNVPGIGAVYSSFNEMSEMLIDSDSQSFQEVVLVEYPNEGSYSVAFLTSETPSFVRDLTGHEEMITVFMPMGPNPFMGGFVLHLAADRVYDVDMTVEEGIRSIVTSGVAMGEDEAPSGTRSLDHGTPGTPGSDHIGATSDEGEKT